MFEIVTVASISFWYCDDYAGQTGVVATRFETIYSIDRKPLPSGKNCIIDHKIELTVENGESGLQLPDETIKTRAPHETAHLNSRGSVPLGVISRMSLVVLEVLILIGFGLAFSVSADPSGRGTHQQFGLPPCVILTLTKTPCPTCGMTTSFAHFVRGRWQKSAEANTSGFLLAVASLCFLPWSLVSLFRKEWWLIRNPELWLTGLSLGWLSVVILEWVVRHFLS